ncbi:MAG: class I SAM-dependent methyltransferase [Proteobacteria bacterium]|nr:class I SAM-dependent methyltransferase [Pseudomonadota bacterium]
MSATDKAGGNEAQIEFWNATAGRTWAGCQALLDRQLEPLGAEAMAALAPATGDRILDIGCGCGQTSVLLAEHAGPSGSVVGVDISEPMLAVARARPVPPGANPPTFQQADVQTADLGDAVFDAVFSRFGVMFFSDPVLAFGNIRRAMKPGGRLAFVCWRPLPLNPWMLVPMDAARPLLPPLPPPPDPTAPGPFAFADGDRVRAILTAAGFAQVQIRPHDRLIGSGNLDDAITLALRVGPLGSVLRESPDLAPAVSGVVRTALSAYVTPAGVLMPAAVWIVTAARE